MAENCKVSDKIKSGLIKLVNDVDWKLKLTESLMPEKTSEEEDEFMDASDEFGSEILRELAFRKLRRDVVFVQTIISELLTEIKTESLFQNFQNNVEDAKLAQAKKSEYVAMYQGQKWISKQFESGNKLRKLQRDLKLYHQETKLIVKEKDKEIKEANTKLKDAKNMVPEWKQREKKYAGAKKEYLTFQLKKEEQDVARQIDTVKQEQPKEMGAHTSLTSFLNFTIEERNETLKSWKEKVEKEFQEEREQLLQLQGQLDAKKATYKELDKQFREYEEVVEEYKRQKKEEAEKAKKEEKILNATIKIQSWWKGHLVRQGMMASLRKKIRAQKKTSKR